MLKHIYFELTNKCNRQCSFCPPVRRPLQFMATQDALLWLEQAAVESEAVYWHIQGEPLLHPDFDRITAHAKRLGLTLKLTTNATFLPGEILLSGRFSQINFSLQSLNEVPETERLRVRKNIAEFTKRALKECPELYLNYRWWQDAPPADLAFFAEEFGIEESLWLPGAGRRSRKVTGRLYVNLDGKFQWPGQDLPSREKGLNGTCHALLDQCGILCDGTVVPCCLDAEGALALGNLHTQSLKEILSSPKAESIRQGFLQRKRIMPLCQSCGFAARFDS